MPGSFPSVLSQPLITKVILSVALTCLYRFAARERRCPRQSAPWKSKGCPIRPGDTDIVPDWQPWLPPERRNCRRTLVRPILEQHRADYERNRRRCVSRGNEDQAPQSRYLWLTLFDRPPGVIHRSEVAIPYFRFAHYSTAITFRLWEFGNAARRAHSTSRLATIHPATIIVFFRLAWERETISASSDPAAYLAPGGTFKAVFLVVI